MKKVLLGVILLYTQVSGAGHDQGGGGHICKSQAQLYVNNISAVIDEDSSLAARYPEWASLKEKLNPIANPGFVLKILKGPIQGCPNTENALACGRPRLNTLELFCGENGWNSLELKEKYRLLIHELYWWSPLDDTNYFYSNKMIDDLFDRIKRSGSINQNYLRLRDGEIKSLETMLNSVSLCKPTNKGGDIWQDVNGQLTCTPKPRDGGHTNNRCYIEYVMDYSVIINNKFSLNRVVNTIDTGFSQASVPLGTIFTEQKCKNLIREVYFPSKSMEWFTPLGRVKNGDLIVQQTGNQKICFKEAIEFSHDSSTWEIGSINIKRVVVPCPQ